MDEGTRVHFAKALCNTTLPATVPAHYVRFWDLACDKWHRMLGNKSPQYNDRALMATIADALKERDDRIAALEARVGIAANVAEGVGEPETTTANVGPPETVTLPARNDVPPLVTQRIDMRTRAGRAMKEQQAEIVGA